MQLIGAKSRSGTFPELRMACPHGLAAGQMSTGRDASGAVLTLRYSFQEMIAPGERPRWWRLHRSPAGRGAAPARRWACPKYQQVTRAPNFVTGFGKEKGGFQRGKPPFAHFQGNVALLRCLQQSKRTGMIRLPVGGSSLRQGRSQGWLLAPALRPHS